MQPVPCAVLCTDAPAEARPACAGRLSKKADLAAFPDEKTVSAYACEPLAWAVDRGLINGVAQGGESWLEPQAGATRAQVATILMRFLKQK